MKELIEKITDQFKEMIPERNDELIQAFKKMLLQKLEYIKKHPSDCIEEKEKFQKIYIINAAERIFKLVDLDSIKRELIEDKNLNEIRRISLNVFFKTATEKMKDKTIIEDVDTDKEIAKLKELFKYVQPYNQDEARVLLSEAILDAMFIKNPNTSIISLRLSKEKQRANKNTESR